MNIHVLDTSPKGRGNFIEEQHLTPRREVKTYAYTTMSDRVGARVERETTASPHFVTHTKRQKVADCRADGWTSLAGNAPTTSARGSRPVLEARECVSTHLFPRSGTQWRHFWFRLFRKKSGIRYDIQSELFAETKPRRRCEVFVCGTIRESPLRWFILLPW